MAVHSQRRWRSSNDIMAVHSQRRCRFFNAVMAVHSQRRWRSFNAIMSVHSQRRWRLFDAILAVHSHRKMAAYFQSGWFSQAGLIGQFFSRSWGLVTITSTRICSTYAFRVPLCSLSSFSSCKQFSLFLQRTLHPFLVLNPALSNLHRCNDADLIRRDWVSR